MFTSLLECMFSKLESLTLCDGDLIVYALVYTFSSVFILSVSFSFVVSSGLYNRAKTDLFLQLPSAVLLVNWSPSVVIILWRQQWPFWLSNYSKMV